MKDIAYKHALKNALDFGEAEVNAVLRKVIMECPELKKDISFLLPKIQEVVSEVNSLSKNAVKVEITRYNFQSKKKSRKGKFQDLPNPSNPVLRFAPNPSGPLHLGHCRAAILNDEYAKKYDGKLILRIEDTDPTRVDPKAYALIEKGLKWLEIKYHKVVVQSTRLDLYYKYAEDLLKINAAYVCTCKQSNFKKLRDSRKYCNCRQKSSEENQKDFNKMFTSYNPGEAVVRLKTDINLSDPAMREFVILRISTEIHPKLKNKRVYPLYNFAVVIDDHLLEITHVLRGKDHLINTKKQEFIYQYFSWDKPEFVHYGMLKIQGLELSTSKIAKGIKEGKFKGWDDPILGTLPALERKGINPKAIRKAMLDIGINNKDINFNWKNLFAYNREIIEKNANRYFFVENPRKIRIYPVDLIKKKYYALLHPDFPKKGNRTLEFGIDKDFATAYISELDFSKIEPKKMIRLMGAFNVEIIKKIKDSMTVKIINDDLNYARKKKIPLIHWVGKKHVNVEVRKNNGTTEIGYGEIGLKKVDINSLIQFERYGFVKIDNKDATLITYFVHK